VPAGIVLVLLTLVLAACGQAAPPATTAPSAAGAATPAAATTTGATRQRIRIAYLKWGLLPVVKARGTLEEALTPDGVDIEWVGPFPSFAPLLEAINAGSADFSAGGDIPALSGLAGQVPICLLGARPPQVEAEAILVRKDSPIASVGDLAGKKVAVNRGGWGEDMLLRALDRAGVARDRVERVYMSPTDALPAFSQGQVDAWAVWDPYVALAEVEHNARRIASGDVAPHYGLYVVRPDFLKNQPATVEKTLALLQRQGEWATNTPADAASILGKELGLSEPVSQRMAEHLPGETIVPVGSSVVADLQRAADWLNEVGAIPRKIEVATSLCPVQASGASR
jgi:sulfonate transport system substrate-binding protein